MVGSITSDFYRPAPATPRRPPTRVRVILLAAFSAVAMLLSSGAQACFLGIGGDCHKQAAILTVTPSAPKPVSDVGGGGASMDDINNAEVDLRELVATGHLSQFDSDKAGVNLLMWNWSSVLAKGGDGAANITAMAIAYSNGQSNPDPAITSALASSGALTNDGHGNFSGGTLAQRASATEAYQHNLAVGLASAVGQGSNTKLIADLDRMVASGGKIINQDGNGVIGENSSGLIGQDGNGIINQDGNGLTGQKSSGLIGQDGNGIINQDGNGLTGQKSSGLIGQDGNGIINQDGNGLTGQKSSGLIGQDGNGIISQDGNGLSGQRSSGLIGQDGNGIISQDGNGLSGQRSSGLIGQDGNGIISQDGNGLSGQRSSGLIGQDGNGIISQDGNGLSGQRSSGLIGQDGNGIISQDGNGLTGQKSSGLIGQDGNGIISQDGNGFIGKNSSGLTAKSANALSAAAAAIIAGDVPTFTTQSVGQSKSPSGGAALIAQLNALLAATPNASLDQAALGSIGAQRETLGVGSPSQAVAAILEQAQATAAATNAAVGAVNLVVQDRRSLTEAIASRNLDVVYQLEAKLKADTATAKTALGAVTNPATLTALQTAIFNATDNTADSEIQQLLSTQPVHIPTAAETAAAEVAAAAASATEADTAKAKAALDALTTVLGTRPADQKQLKIVDDATAQAGLATYEQQLANAKADLAQMVAHGASAPNIAAQEAVVSAQQNNVDVAQAMIANDYSDKEAAAAVAQSEAQIAQAKVAAMTAVLGTDRPTDPQQLATINALMAAARLAQVQSDQASGIANIVRLTAQKASKSVIQAQTDVLAKDATEISRLIPDCMAGQPLVENTALITQAQTVVSGKTSSMGAGGGGPVPVVAGMPSGSALQSILKNLSPEQTGELATLMPGLKNFSTAQLTGLIAAAKNSTGFFATVNSLPVSAAEKQMILSASPALANLNASQAAPLMQTVKAAASLPVRSLTKYLNDVKAGADPTIALGAVSGAKSQPTQNPPPAASHAPVYSLQAVTQPAPVPPSATVSQPVLATDKAKAAGLPVPDKPVAAALKAKAAAPLKPLGETTTATAKPLPAQSISAPPSSNGAIATAPKAASAVAKPAAKTPLASRIVATPPIATHGAVSPKPATQPLQVAARPPMAHAAAAAPVVRTAPAVRLPSVVHVQPVVRAAVVAPRPAVIVPVRVAAPIMIPTPPLGVRR